MYVADSGNQRIRKLTSAGVVSTLAGSGTAGFAEGSGTVARFNLPVSVAVDGAGNVYVADYYNHRIRKVTSSGVVSTLAGSGTAGYAEGTGAAASFNAVAGVAVDGGGTVYVGDSGNNRVRQITSGGVVSTLAGSGVSGYVDGPGTAARFARPFGVAVNGAGEVYVADYGNHRVRKVASGGVVSTVAGSGTAGYVDGAALTARFNSPVGVAVDTSGNVYVGDYGNHRVRTTVPVSVLVQSGVTGASAVAVPFTLTGLTAGTTYYFRVVGSNPFYTVNGALLSFTTTGVAPAGFVAQPGTVPTVLAGNPYKRSAALTALRQTEPLPGVAGPERADVAALQPITVSGAGTVDAPVGSLALAPEASGAGQYDLLVEQAAGGSAPVGHVAFVLRFGATQYEFASTQLARLTLAAGTATITGTCTINGVAGFDLTVTVSEGQAADGSPTTTLRLHVHDTATETLVLDTKPASNR